LSKSKKTANVRFGSSVIYWNEKGHSIFNKIIIEAQSRTVCLFRIGIFGFSRRCPTLREITFSNETSSLPRLSETMFARALGSLNLMTKLKLNWKTNSPCIEFFSHLGSSCPNLKQLELKRMPFQLDQQLAFVLGSKAQLIPSSVKEKMWGEEGNLYRFQFPISEHISPLCHSMEHLSIQSANTGKVCIKYQQQVNSSAFILRHCLQLKKLALKFELHNIKTNTSLAVLLLYNMLQSGRFLQTSEINQRDNQLPINWTINSAPPRTDSHFKNNFFHCLISYSLMNDRNAEFDRDDKLNGNDKHTPF